MKSLLEHHDIKKTQQEVDFIIPFLDIDRRYFLDPSLLNFTPSALARAWSAEILEFLKLLKQVMKSGNKEKFQSLLNIGEANDIGLGYCADGTDGSGFGKKISENIERILRKNADFRMRGFKRLEELQWLDKNIGADRVSDLAVHILKRHLIAYTQRECRRLGIPMEPVHVNKVFDGDTLSWVTVETKLPVNPLKVVRDALNPHPPILFIPKRMVRPLPLFLNYHSLYGFITAGDAASFDEDISGLEETKPEIVKYMIEHPEKSEQYVRARERKAPIALFRHEFDSGILAETEKLSTIKSGHAGATDYRNTVEKIFDYLFDDLEFFKREQRTMLGDMKRDIVFRNNASTGIFQTFKTQHGATHLVVDAKNTDHVTPDDISRVADYLNNNIGRVAIIVSRKTTAREVKRLRTHAYAQLKDQNKVILFVNDAEMKKWVTNKTRLLHIAAAPKPFFEAETSIGNKYSELITS